MDGLRITETNSVNDSKGRAFGLEGDDFIYVIVGFVVALGLYLLLSVLFETGRLASLMLALPFVAGPLAWVTLLRHNKPSGYAEDWFEERFSGEGWSFVTGSQPSPLGKTVDESDA